MKRILETPVRRRRRFRHIRGGGRGGEKPTKLKRGKSNHNERVIRKSFEGTKG